VVIMEKGQKDYATECSVLHIYSTNNRCRNGGRKTFLTYGECPFESRTWTDIHRLPKHVADDGSGQGSFFFQHDWFYFLHIEKRFIKDGSARLSVSICFGGHQGCIADLPQATCRGWKPTIVLRPGTRVIDCDDLVPVRACYRVRTATTAGRFVHIVLPFFCCQYWNIL